MNINDLLNTREIYFRPNPEYVEKGDNFTHNRNKWGEIVVKDGERLVKFKKPFRVHQKYIINNDRKVYMLYTIENTEIVRYEWYRLKGEFVDDDDLHVKYYVFVIRDDGFTRVDDEEEIRKINEAEEVDIIEDNEEDGVDENEGEEVIDDGDDEEGDDEEVANEEEEADVNDEAEADVNDEAVAGLDEQIPTEIDEVDGTIQSLIREQINKGYRNIILTGAPGTGKTHAAKNFVKQYYETFEEQSDNNEYTLDGNKVPFKFVQFHPSYDYTDFVQGIKPDEEGNFTLKDGVFKRFCDAVIKINRPEIRFFFIIDEINRADLSSVFGELMYSLEYRGEENKIELQYSYFGEKTADKTKNTTYTGNTVSLKKNNLFFIPKNVIIIGTMNDIDRSVEAFDFALRRRFVWIEVSADDTLDEIWDSRQHNDRYRRLDGRYRKDDDEHPLKRLKKLNNEIENKESLGKQYQIGGAYIKDIEGDDNGYDYDSIWRYRIEPLIGEYMRGVKDKESILKEWEKKFKNTEEDVTPVNDGVNGDELDEDGQN